MLIESFNKSSIQCENLCIKSVVYGYSIVEGLYVTVTAPIALFVAVSLHMYWPDMSGSSYVNMHN